MSVAHGPLLVLAERLWSAEAGRRLRVPLEGWLVHGGRWRGHGAPAAALAWLANTLTARGEHLDAGTIVLSGAPTASVPLKAGSIATAEFDGLGWVGIRCQ